LAAAPQGKTVIPREPPAAVARVGVWAAGEPRDLLFRVLQTTVFLAPQASEIAAKQLFLV